MDCVDVSFQKDIIIQETYLIGEIIMWPKTSDLPKGFISCDGSSYSTTGPYNKLYGVIDYKFGGSSGNFKIPNLNVSNTNTPMLIKGDPNMSNNSVNQNLSTGDISGGVNKIQNSILPQHNHNITTSVVSSFQMNNLSLIGNRANKTMNNADLTEDGAQNVINNQLLPAHSHDIQYNGTDNISVSGSNISFTLTMNQNSSNYENVTPDSTIVHYIIFTGVYE